MLCFSINDTRWSRVDGVVLNRRCSVSYSLLWRPPRPPTEVSSKACLVEELSLWTGRTSVSATWLFFPLLLNSNVFQTPFFFWFVHLLAVVRSWRNSRRQGLQEPGPAHPRPREHGGHEGCGVGRSGRTGPRSDSSGRERAETGRAGGEDRSHDGQRWVILQARSRCTCPPLLSHPEALIFQFYWLAIVSLPPADDAEV